MNVKNDLKVELVSVDVLKPAAYNPRKSSAKQDTELEESIKRFGLVDPIIANCDPERKNIVIGGHFRLRIAKKLGYKEVPVAYINISDVEKEKELNLRLNKNTGEWDFSKLFSEFDHDLLVGTGFNEDELTAKWDDLATPGDESFNVEKTLKEIKVPKVKLGDVYQLGNHRLVCGDSTDLEAVNRLMGTVKVDVIYTDPVFNIGLNYDKGFGGDSKYGGSVDDNKSIESYTNLIRGSLVNGLTVCKHDAHIFYYCDQRYIWLFQQLYEELGVANKRVCIWIKNNQNPTPKTAFNKSYEPCVYGTVGQPYLSGTKNLTEVLNKEVGTGNSGLDNIMEFFDIWLSKRIPLSEYEHPTSKPPSLHEKPLKRCSKLNGVVLDLFAGSGSTMTTCENLGRKCYMVELDPVFCEVIIRRYEKLTEKRAVKVG